VEISKSLKPRLREIIKGDPELERITEEALDLTGEEMINRKNLEHLKMPKPVPNLVEEPEIKINNKEPSRPVIKSDPNKGVERIPPRPPVTTFTNPSE
jgi:hypothetical protein